MEESKYIQYIQLIKKEEWPMEVRGFRQPFSLFIHVKFLNKYSPQSKCNESHLEEEISLFLTNNGIKYERQAKFPNIKFKKELPFDFFIPSKNVIIECQGEQHFEKSKIFKDEYRFTKDRIKYNGCLKNGFKLLYYTNIKNYEKYFNKLTYNEKNLFKDKNIILEKIKRD